MDLFGSLVKPLDSLKDPMKYIEIQSLKYFEKQGHLGDSVTEKRPQLSLRIGPVGGAWVAQSVKRPTSAQVMISQSVSSSPASGSVLTAQSLEPVSDSVSPSL